MIKFRYKRKEPTNIVGGSNGEKTGAGTLNTSSNSTTSQNPANTSISSNMGNSSISAKKDDTKENCKPISIIPLQKSSSCNNAHTLKSSTTSQLITSAPISIVNSTSQMLQYPQHCQMVLTGNMGGVGGGGGGTLPRSTPKKMVMDPREGHKSATLTRQSNTLQNNRKLLPSLAKVASTAELAGLGYGIQRPQQMTANTTTTTTISSGIILSPETIAERDRCINAVIVSKTL